MSARRISAEEFEREYAERSGVTVEWLREHGRVVRPCDCGEDGCEGWKSVSAQAAECEHDWRCPWCWAPTTDPCRSIYEAAFCTRLPEES